MEAERARKIAGQTPEVLAKALRDGRSEELTRSLAMLARVPKYNLGNVTPGRA